MCKRNEQGENESLVVDHNAFEADVRMSSQVMSYSYVAFPSCLNLSINVEYLV